MERFKKLWYDVIESLWFLPSLITVGSAALAIVLVRTGDRLLGDMDAAEIWWLFGGSPQGATSVLQSISGSIITVTGVVFSVTIIALQLASSQFTPRVLRQFMADRANQLVLGVFIGTFTFTLLVQRTVRSADGQEFVPYVAVTVAVLLALTSIGFLIFFINHVARSIQASVIIESAAESSRRIVRDVYPEVIGGPAADGGFEAQGRLSLPDARAVDVVAEHAGYLQALEEGRLVELAREHDLVIRCEARVGDHLLPGERAMRVWGRRELPEGLDAKLRDALVMGIERTPHGDPRHGLVELMDIAVKGLSPSVNDPTTAIDALNRLAEILLDLAWRRRGDRVEADEDGEPRLVVRRPDLDEAVALAFDQIRHYGAPNPSFAERMIHVLAELVALSPRAARGPFLSQLHHVIESAHAHAEHEGDRRRIDEAAERALVRADAPPPERRPHGEG